MESAKTVYQKYIFVCENARESEACCMPEGQIIREALKEKIKTMGLASQIRVSRSGCLDVCKDGPNVMLFPEGRWFKKVTLEDTQSIVNETIKDMTCSGL